MMGIFDDDGASSSSRTRTRETTLPRRSNSRANAAEKVAIPQTVGAALLKMPYEIGRAFMVPV